MQGAGLITRQRRLKTAMCNRAQAGPAAGLGPTTALGHRLSANDPGSVVLRLNQIFVCRLLQQPVASDFTIRQNILNLLQRYWGVLGKGRVY